MLTDKSFAGWKEEWGPQNRLKILLLRSTDCSIMYCQTPEYCRPYFVRVDISEVSSNVRIAECRSWWILITQATNFAVVEVLLQFTYLTLARRRRPF